MFQISASTRLIFAMLRLAASLEEGLGRGLLSLIKPYYPDQKIDANPASIGHKMMAIVRKQVQNDPVRASDLIQDWFTYMVGRKQDFSKDFKTWEEALAACYTNLRRRGITESQGFMKRRKRDKSIDDAYGKRGEGGDTPSGGEGAMPTPGGNLLGMALDDKAAIKQFVTLIDEHMSDLRNSLSEDGRKLFDLIFEDNEGTFSSDIKANMNQASAMKEKYPELYKKNEKRWSGFIGDLRKKLLNEIHEYIENNMTQDEYNVLKETFYGDVDASYVRRKEQEKATERLDYQQGLDERKISRWKWEMENGELPDKEQKSFENLKKKLTDSGVNTNAIPAEKDPKIDGWRIQKSKKNRAANMFTEFAVATRVASIKSSPAWCF